MLSSPRMKGRIMIRKPAICPAGMAAKPGRGESSSHQWWTLNRSAPSVLWVCSAPLGTEVVPEV
ncbi:hypothetical protein D3C73_1606800 [compost metagenome]